MRQTDTLKSLEIVLESFLERAVAQKAGRLQVIDGINRLDDLARVSDTSTGQVDLTDRLGVWLADHADWLKSGTLRGGDRNRISGIMSSLRESLTRGESDSPAGEKIRSEIDRWAAALAGPGDTAAVAKVSTGQKVVLKRGPESLDEAGLHPSSEDSIGLFAATLETLTDLFKDMSHDRLHLMSVLNDALKSATLRSDREALLLSALIIYYLRQNGYMVEPFVKRLKEAERLQRKAGKDA